MRLAGYGIESGSPTILKAIDKSGQTVPKMEIAIAETKRVLGDDGVDTSWMIGAPGETERTVAESVEFCKRVGLKPSVWFFVTSYPGTTFWQLALNKGQGEATQLAVVQQIHPMYVNFTQSAAEVMKLRSAMEAGQIGRASCRERV